MGFRLAFKGGKGSAADPEPARLSNQPEEVEEKGMAEALLYGGGKGGERRKAIWEVESDGKRKFDFSRSKGEKVLSQFALERRERELRRRHQTREAT